MQFSLKLSLEAVRAKFNTKLRLVLLIAIAVFFFSAFNAISGYLTPVVLVDSGLSELQMGLIYSTSSIFGMILDIVLARVLKTTHYKRMMLYGILVAALFPLSLLVSTHIIFYLLAMFFWGLYSNLMGFAYYDFSAREAKIAFHATSLSLLFIFLDLGDFIGMLVAEPISNIESHSTILLILGSILLLSLVSLLFSFFVKGHNETKEQAIIEDPGKLSKILLVSKKLWPMLLFGTLLNVIEAILWTITPIVERIAPQLENFGGILLALTIIPSFFINILMQRIPTKHGKKRVALYAFILGSIFMALLGFTTTLVPYLILTFLLSICFALVYPLLGGAFADYLQESKTFDNEILSSKDLFANFGYVIGPILGTYLLTITESLKLFTVMGIFTAIIAIGILIFTPKSIPFYDRSVLKETK